MTPDSFASDGFLTKDIQPSNEVYVKFKIKFQKGFTEGYGGKTGIIKLFRILSYDGVGERSKFFKEGNSAPIYLYEWGNNTYGVRHFHAFRCDPQEVSYFCTAPVVGSSPRKIFRGDMSANYTSDLKWLDVHPSIPDLLNGGYLPKEGTVWHEQVFSDKWHELAFYVKLNSAPGVQDGILRHWFDGKLIISMPKVPWIGTGGNMNAKWNSISFGGNDFYRFNLDKNAPLSERERWYAIDDVVISSKLPKTQ